MGHAYICRQSVPCYLSLACSRSRERGERADPKLRFPLTNQRQFQRPGWWSSPNPHHLGMLGIGVEPRLSQTCQVYSAILQFFAELMRDTRALCPLRQAQKPFITAFPRCTRSGWVREKARSARGRRDYWWHSRGQRWCGERVDLRATHLHYALEGHCIIILL